MVEADDGVGRRPQVVIVGGGFGGVFAARRLARADVDVTLIDRGTSNVFQPLLYQCATGLLSEGQITSPLRTLLRRHRSVRVVLGEAHGLDVTRGVVTAKRPDGSTFELDYDYLIVAAGMRTSYFGHPEFARFAPGMKNIDDALAIRRRVLSAFEMAETIPDREQRREWLTFAVVGAGPTGVELAGQIRELATRTIGREYRSIDPTEARVLLFDGAGAVLASFGPSLAAKAQKTLDGLDIEIRLGVLVTDVDATGLVTTTKDGTESRYPARTVLWTAGVEAAPFLTKVAEATAVPQDRQGRIAVEADLSVPGHPDVWVIGDAASRDGLPGVAEVAMQGGLHVGGVIRRRVAHPAEKPAPFHYRDLGSAAYISRGHAVLKLGKLELSGFLGWVLWGAIHIAFLAGVRNRFATLASWLLTLGLNRRAERAITYGDPTAAEQPYP
ncbi:NAD(P)/FAD-dependent oxidoreductase [Pseudonocardia sp. Cha107L01]|uniref:NAD(P)/FAD-dependent oxidoreductase n=1 Tax=Pseudonocardia sp. Cha107L01 TaxID=3457576 RepID=UPI00403E61DF